MAGRPSVAKVREVCRSVRSKQAGPFWVTIDMFFDGPESFSRYARGGALSPALFARIYGADPSTVKTFAVEDLAMVKTSFPRTTPAGGVEERDLHSGQQYARLLDVELD